MISKETLNDFKQGQTVEEKRELIQELKNELKKERPEREDFFNENTLIWRVSKTAETLYIYGVSGVCKVKNMSRLTSNELNFLIGGLENGF